MKKLMIALGAVAMTVGLQAASVDWQATITEQATVSHIDLSTAGSGYMAYLFTDAAWQSVTAKAVDNVLKAEDFTGWTGNAATITASEVGGGAGVKYDTGLQSPTASSGNYWIIFANDENVIASPKAYAATEYEKQTDQHTVAKWISNPPTVINSTTYTFASVPEPTSGLLLLLGMAGLALRRRRA